MLKKSGWDAHTDRRCHLFSLGPLAAGDGAAWALFGAPFLKGQMRGCSQGRAGLLRTHKMRCIFCVPSTVAGTVRATLNKCL